MVKTCNNVGITHKKVPKKKKERIFFLWFIEYEHIYTMEILKMKSERVGFSLKLI